jgi:hypothetical protein
MVFPKYRHTPFGGTAAASAMFRINFTVAAFSRPFSRIYRRYSNSGRGL